MSYNCRLCRSNEIASVLHLDHVPPDVQALLTEQQLGQQQSVEFTVYQCSNCGLVQAPMQLKSDYYNDYLMSTTFSTQLTDYLDGLVQEFVDTYSLYNSKVVDIGCGDGAFMYPFARRNIQITGIEPSDRSRSAAQQSGFEVYPGYVTPDTCIPGAPFDAFVSRQVFEHVEDIAGFLLGIRKNLKPGAVGIIEVPSLEKSIQDQRFYDFFPDHVNYYSLSTLKLALEINGFDVLDLRHTMFDEYNVAIVRRRNILNLSELAIGQSQLTQSITDLFQQKKKLGLTTAIWGAGAKGLSIMTNLDVDIIDHVIDSDSNKHGRYTAVSELLIEPSDILDSTKIDLIVITAVAYQQAILTKLKHHHNYSGEVYVLSQSGLKKISL